MSLTFIQAVLWTIVLAGLFWGAVTDLKERIIPDELAILIALAGLILCLAARPGQLWLSLIAAFVVFLGSGLLCRYGMIGGGDVKLMAAVVLLVPPHEIGELLIAIALAGGVLSSVYLGASLMLGSVPPESVSVEADGAVALSRLVQARKRPDRLTKAGALRNRHSWRRHLACCRRPKMFFRNVLFILGAFCILGSVAFGYLWFVSQGAPAEPQRAAPAPAPAARGDPDGRPRGAGGDLASAGRHRVEANRATRT